MPSASSNIAHEQQGNIMLLGGATRFPAEFSYQELKSLFSKGIAYDHVGFEEDFCGAAISTKMVTDLSASCTIAINSQLGGAARFTTTATNADKASLALGLNFYETNGLLVFATKIRQNTAITLRAVEVGFSDALSQTNGLAFSSHGTPIAVAGNAAVLAIDSADSIAVWTANSVKASGTPQKVTTTVAPVADTYQKVMVMLDQSGNAFFFVDEVLVASISNAITPSTPVTPWITLKSQSAAVKTMDVEYFSVHGSR